MKLSNSTFPLIVILDLLSWFLYNHRAYFISEKCNVPNGIHPGTSCIEIDNWLDFMTEFSRYCAYITQVPQTIGFLPRFYRAPLLIGFGRGRPWKTKLWNIIRLSLCKLEIILRLLLTLCFLIFVKSIQFSTVCSLLFNNTCDTSYSCISGWNTSLPNLSYNLWRSIYCHNI